MSTQIVANYVNNCLTKMPIFAASVDLPRDERSGLYVVLSLSRAFSSSSFSMIALDFSYCKYRKWATERETKRIKHLKRLSYRNNKIIILTKRRKDIYLTFSVYKHALSSIECGVRRARCQIFQVLALLGESVRYPQKARANQRILKVVDFHCV